VPFDEPGRVVDLPKGEQRLMEILDSVEGAHPKQVLLERADEALRTAISLRSPHEGGRARDAEERKLLLESIGHVLTTMIVAHRKPAPDPLSKAARAAPHPLPDWFQRLEAGVSANRGAQEVSLPPWDWEEAHVRPRKVS
jgi:hypothetical protein